MKNRGCHSSSRSFAVAREGWIFISLFGVLSAFFLLSRIYLIGFPLLLLTIFSVYFFRNPERVPPKGDDLVISPADGRVIEVADVEDNDYTGGKARKISVFMSIFNVHVNRSPVGGCVRDILYHPGKFLVASRDKASKDNERNAILLDTGGGSLLAVVQVAGLVARRIVCYMSKGDSILKGERLGLIRFGSRVELYLPLDSEIYIKVGNKVRAGSTIVGRLK